MRRQLCYALASKAHVIVAGAGPAGLTLALLLSKYDVSVQIFEKRTSLPTHPQAHFINNRTMEIFRPLDGLAEDVTRGTPPLREWRRFIYSETVKSHPFGRVDHFYGQDTVRTILSPEGVAHLSQNRLLPLILQRLQQSDNVQLNFSKEVIDCVSTHKGARVIVKDTQLLHNQELSARAVVIANGANSDLVQKLGITLTGSGTIQNLINVYFRSKRLSELMSTDPAMLYFIFNPEVVMVIVVHDLKQGEFVVQIPFFPPLQEPAHFGREQCAAFIHSAAGERITDLHIESIRPWIMKEQVAETFQRENIFLVGDAAHVFPPAGGFGMNTGIQDAHNLSWKLAAVIKGQDSSSLLNSYTRERRHVAISNARLSVANWEETVAVASVLGLNPKHGRILSDIISGPVAKLLPRPFSKALLETAFRIGRRMSGDQWVLGFWRRRNIQQYIAAGQSLRLQFPKEDLGFTYTEESEISSHDHQLNVERRREDSISVVSQIAVGRRMPHGLVQLRHSKRLVSTLDFVSWSKLKCTLFLFNFTLNSCKTLALECPKSLHVNFIVLQSNKSSNHERTTCRWNPYLAFTGFSDLSGDDYTRLSSGLVFFEGTLEHSASLHVCHDTVAVLVRPDGHVTQILGELSLDRLKEAVNNVFNTS